MSTYSLSEGGVLQPQPKDDNLCSGAVEILLEVNYHPAQKNCP